MGLRYVAKAGVQKGISVLPRSQRVNYLFQHHVRRSTVLAPSFLDKRIEFAGDHLGALRRLCPDTGPGFHAVELGTGWFPLVPLCLHVAGADRVTMLDLEDLGRDHMTRQAIEGVLAAHDSGALAERLGPVDEQRIEGLRTALADLDRMGRTAVLERLGLVLRTGDARTLELDRAPDLICSNTVLEHIDPDVLPGILDRFRDLAAPGTLMSNLVDMCDHYAYVDPDVSVYNFLRYSDRAWRLIDNSIQPMNRLRASQYEEMYEQLGIPVTEVHREGCDPLQLVGEPLAPRFKAMDPADVACTSIWFLTRF